MIFAAPIIEELFFRGWLQDRAEHHMPKLMAFAFTAASFTVYHYDAQISLANAAALAVAFSLTKASTNSLLACISLHMIYNCAALVIPMREKLAPAFLSIL